MRHPVLSALLITVLLAGCGGAVAPDAPELLSRAEIDAALTQAAQTGGGIQASSDLAYRAAALRARVAQAQRNDLTEAERRRLLRRAEELKGHQD